MLMTALKELFTANGTTIHKAYADETKNYTITNPCLNLYATGVPEKYLAALSAEEMSDGLMPRLLVVQVEDRGKRQMPERCLPPQGLISKMTNLGNNKFFQYKRVPFGAGAEDVYYRFLDDNDLRLDGGGPKAIFWSRAPELVERVATVLAISRSQSAPAVTIKDLEWAIALVTYSVDLQIYHCSGLDKTFEVTASQEVLEFIQQAAERGEPPSRIFRKFKRYGMKQIQIALQRLAAEERIYHDTGAGSGRPRDRWLAAGMRYG